MLQCKPNICWKFLWKPKARSSGCRAHGLNQEKNLTTCNYSFTEFRIHKILLYLFTPKYYCHKVDANCLKPQCFTFCILQKKNHISSFDSSTPSQLKRSWKKEQNKYSTCGVYIERYLLRTLVEFNLFIYVKKKSFHNNISYLTNIRHCAAKITFNWVVEKSSSSSLWYTRCIGSLYVHRSSVGFHAWKLNQANPLTASTSHL